VVVGIDWERMKRLERLDQVNWSQLDTELDAMVEKIKSIQDVIRLEEADVPAGQIAEERKEKLKMVNVTPTPTVPAGVTVDAVTKPAATMKSNWAFVVMILAQLINFFTQGKIDIPVEYQEIGVTVLTTVAGALGIWWRTRASSVSPTGAALLASKQQKGKL
jgi:hypothetical protein